MPEDPRLNARPVCLGGENPNRLVSLWEIVNLFSAEILIDRMLDLATLEISDWKAVGPRTEVLQSLKDIREACAHLGMTRCAEQATRAITYVHKNSNREDGIVALANDLFAEIMTDLARRTFLFVPETRSHCVDNPNLCSEQVAKAFPSAVPDIREAGNCLAADCNTAAVFHLMRAVEWGLRALASNLGVRKVRMSRKPGSNRSIPISYAEWERILDELQTRVDDKIARLKRGPAKQKLQEFYYPALQDIRAIRDAWRNHTMHTRAEYSAKQADAILEHVTRLLATLATRISE